MSFGRIVFPIAQFFTPERCGKVTGDLLIQSHRDLMKFKACILKLQYQCSLAFFSFHTIYTVVLQLSFALYNACSGSSILCFQRKSFRVPISISQLHQTLPMNVAHNCCQRKMHQQFIRWNEFQDDILHLLCPWREKVPFCLVKDIKHFIFPRFFHSSANTAKENTILPPLSVANGMKYKPTQKPRIKPSVE